MRELKILPSLLAADFAKLGEEARAVENAGADLLHLDVMDGHFVPNISFGAGVIKAVRPHCALPFDVHLMIAPCDAYLADFAASGADIITVHVEAGAHLHRSLGAIRALGKRAGVALNPATPASAIANVLDMIDLVCVMSVNPGFGGQSFITAQLETIRQVAQMCRENASGHAIDIEVDGGVTAENAGAVARAGANFLVAGSSVFKGGADKDRTDKDRAAVYEANIKAIRHAAMVGRGELV